MTFRFWISLYLQRASDSGEDFPDTYIRIQRLPQNDRVARLLPKFNFRRGWSAQVPLWLGRKVS